MAPGTLERLDVAKRDHKKPARPVEAQPTEPLPPFLRIELQADPQWVAELDRAARSLGISRSAYIRMACNRQMAADRREGSAPE